MTTNNAIDTSLSGQTGTGSFAGSVSPAFTTPSIDAATAVSIAFSPTTGGITGTTAADNAAAGKVGEFVSSFIATGSAVSISTTVAKDVTSISLTAGDWNVWGNVFWQITGSASSLACWVSSTSATHPDGGLTTQYNVVNSGNGSLAVPMLRFSLSTTTTIYLSTLATFASGTITASGGIYARRMR